MTPWTPCLQSGDRWSPLVRTRRALAEHPHPWRADRGDRQGGRRRDRRPREHQRHIAYGLATQAMTCGRSVTVVRPASPPTSPRSPTPSTRPCSATDQTKEQAVLAAYARSWDVYADAMRRLDPSRLPTAFAGPALEAGRRDVASQKAKNEPVLIDVNHHPKVVLLRVTRRGSPSTSTLATLCDSGEPTGSAATGHGRRSRSIARRRRDGLTGKRRWSVAPSWFAGLVRALPGALFEIRTRADQGDVLVLRVRIAGHNANRQSARGSRASVGRCQRTARSGNTIGLRPLTSVGAATARPPDARVAATGTCVPAPVCMSVSRAVLPADRVFHGGAVGGSRLRGRA